MNEQKKWTVKEFRDAGLMALMPNGFEIYNYYDEEPLTHRYRDGSLDDCEITCIGCAYDDFVPALYVDYYSLDKKEESE